ncbi:MAG: hypothetical protein IMZ52_05200, partial [Actinobacteria bacterium]|nr:hypothetical protein [Actinomycetota bacterium]
MAWNSVAASSSVIDHDEWNSMVTYITDDAADLATHTSDSTIHFTVDSINLDELSDVSAPYRQHKIASFGGFWFSA